jgi:hypothetical protein
MHSISNRNFEIHIFALLTFREKIPGCYTEDTRRDRKACIEATRSAVAGHLSDGATKTNSRSALGGRVS